MDCYTKKTAISLIFPASLSSKKNFLRSNIETLENLNFKIKYSTPKNIESWPHESASLAERIDITSKALLDKETEVIISLKGGYGTSDILPYLPWEKLRSYKPKFILGFSDISALMSACYTKLGWPSVHGPMILSKEWKEECIDIRQLLSLLKDPRKHGNIELDPVAKVKDCRGKIFGGCLSVLCHLIGTPFFPKNLKKHILFFEDINENPNRIIRYWNQLIQAGCFEGVEAIVLGNIQNLESDSKKLKKFLAKKIDIPVYSQENIGHGKINLPICIGCEGSIQGHQLSWFY